MPPKLTVHNAEIKTASVEIKTLTISGKQVTLAVFRQLPQARLINDDGSMNGEPWGTVNYHPDPKACPGAQHWHTVWQAGNELRRSTDLREPDLGSFWTEEGSQFLTSVVLDYLTTGTSYLDGGASIPVRTTSGVHTEIEGTIRLRGLSAGMEASRSAVYAYRAAQHAKDYPNMAYHREQADNTIEELRTEVAKYAASTGELFARFDAVCLQEATRREAIRSAHRRLAELPQLFIAV